MSDFIPEDSTVAGDAMAESDLEEMTRWRDQALLEIAALETKAEHAASHIIELDNERITAVDAAECLADELEEAGKAANLAEAALVQANLQIEVLEGVVKARDAERRELLDDALSVCENLGDPCGHCGPCEDAQKAGHWDGPVDPDAGEAVS